MQVAAGLDPGNPEHWSNYGYALLAVQHSWAGRNAFDKALALDGLDGLRRAIALAGRARANYNLGETDRAVADATASLEVEGNPAAAALLGQIALDRGDRDAAKAFWLDAWAMDMRDDALVEALHDLGVSDPAAALEQSPHE
jgi:tetratricopeptide (TPR) repeat protein